MNHPQNQPTIEYAPFKLAENVDEPTLLAAADALHTGFLSRQPGFIRRDLVKIKDGQWADIIYWNSLYEAEQAGMLVADSPEGLQYFQLMLAEDMNNPEVGVSHLQVLKSYS